MQYINPSINVKAKKIEAIMKHLCDQEEILYASKVQFNFPPNRHLPAQKGYAILTSGFVYLFTKYTKVFQLDERICIFNCSEIKFINNDKGKNTKAALLIKTLPDQNLFTICDGKKMETFFDNLTYIINLITEGLTAQINIPKLSPPIQMKFFPISHALYRRAIYYIHYDMIQNKIPRQTLEGAAYFNNTKIYNEGQILIDSTFHPGNFSSYYAKAIGLDARVYKVIFTEFSDDFMNFFEALLNSSTKIQQIKFSNYTTSAPVFNFTNVPRSNITKYEFFDSSFSLLENFMNGCLNCSHNITDVKLSSLEMQQIDLINTFDNLNKIQCFNNLTSFGLFNMNFGQFPFKVFREFLGLHGKLQSLYFSEIDVDGSTLLTELCKCQTNVNQLHLNHLNFDTNFESNSIVLPRNLVLADFSHSKFKNLTLKPLLEILTSPFVNRELASTDIMVDFSYLQPHENTFVNSFKGIDHTKCQPNIADFNWSGNNLSIDLFNFLTTQKKIHFLSLMDIKVDKPKQFFMSLSKFIKETPTIGIELGSNNLSEEFFIPFFSLCLEMRRIQHFFFQCQPEQVAAAEKLVEMFSSLPNLKEVSVNIQKLPKETYLKLANAIVSNKSIMACNFMNYENDKKDMKRSEITHLLRSFQNLRAPTNMEKRAAFLIANKSTSFNLASTIEANCRKLSHVDLGIVDDF